MRPAWPRIPERRAAPFLRPPSRDWPRRGGPRGRARRPRRQAGGRDPRRGGRGAVCAVRLQLRRPAPVRGSGRGGEERRDQPALPLRCRARRGARGHAQPRHGRHDCALRRRGHAPLPGAGGGSHPEADARAVLHPLPLRRAPRRRAGGGRLPLLAAARPSGRGCGCAWAGGRGGRIPRGHAARSWCSARGVPARVGGLRRRHRLARRDGEAVEGGGGAAVRRGEGWRAEAARAPHRRGRAAHEADEPQADDGHRVQGGGRRCPRHAADHTASID
mmetsp:Transcript_40956/g.131727  ORF Transcript_40956/g.131727 Transcript_40956/m.131727 type:complete len:275 (-) Transcript_40956:166-990(-)